VQYLALIYSDDTAWEAAPPEERAAMYARYRAFADDARAAGVMTGGEELAPTSVATTVRVRHGEAVVTDGPYAEVKEALGGYLLLECDDLDTALEWAARIPGARTGAVEVRPVHVDGEEG
jgi:hypothetical protein